MQNRIEVLRKFVEDIFFNSTEDMEFRYFIMCHMVCVSQLCAMIALKRGENVELATMSGLLHDISTFISLDPNKHAKKGAVLARDILEELKITSAEETDMICSAIKNHSKKSGTFASFDEVLIDADVLQHSLYNVTLPQIEKDRERLMKLIEELGISTQALAPALREYPLKR